MENNNKYSVQDLVISTLDQKPEEFAQGFNSLMIDKLNAAISNKTDDTKLFTSVL